MNNAATTETSNTNEGKNMYTVSPTTGKGFTVTNHITGETIGNDYCEDKVFRSENSANKAAATLNAGRELAQGYATPVKKEVA